MLSYSLTVLDPPLMAVGSNEDIQYPDWNEEWAHVTKRNIKILMVKSDCLLFNLIFTPPDDWS